MNGRGHQLLVMIYPALLCIGCYYDPPANPYCYPTTRGIMPKAKSRKVYVRRQFWTSGFV